MEFFAYNLCNEVILLIDLKEIRSVTDFQRNAKVHVARIKRSKSPLVLTVNGRAEVVVQDARSYQKLLDRVEELEYEREFAAAVQVGLDELDRGLGRPVREVMKYRGR